MHSSYLSLLSVARFTKPEFKFNFVITPICKNVTISYGIEKLINLSKTKELLNGTIRLQSRDLNSDNVPQEVV